MKRREWSPFKVVMPVGEKCCVDGKTVYVHHVDDQGGWEHQATLHPKFIPGPKPKKYKWECEWKHSYENCKCHLELREYGQDESIYYSGDNPSSRWAISGRSYAISKSRGVARMVSAFKDYSSRGMCLRMSAPELEVVNADRVGCTYADGQSMEPLMESPGCRIIEPSKDGDGYWNFDKMSVQTQDIMAAMDTLEPEIQQLHQFDWSSGHAKSREGGLLVSSMNLNYGGVGGKQLRDTELTEDNVGNGEAFLYKTENKRGKVKWFKNKPTRVKKNETLTKVDCRVYAGDMQNMSFGEKASHPPPPFNYVDAPFEDEPELDENGEQKKTKSGILKFIKGYAGQAKGLAQVLWERGLYQPGMKKRLESDDEDYPQLCASTILGNCSDFREETGAMETLLLEQGHLCLFSSKGHPEIAGAGIEFDWGVSKKFFRKDNKHMPKYCERDVRESLKKIDLSTSFNTSRKARSYMMAYMSDAHESHLLIEKFVKVHK